jgi:Rhodopirellula transposase DDE domain
MRHYPTGASKWNIIEHRLLSEISKEWAGRPLDRYGTILNYIRRTNTEQGLTVTACLIRKKYSTRIKVTDEEMKQFRALESRVRENRLHGSEGGAANARPYRESALLPPNILNIQGFGPANLTGGISIWWCPPKLPASSIV